MYIKDFSWRRRHHLPGPDESRPMEANVRVAGHPQKARAASCSCLPHGLAKQDPVVFLSRQLCWPQRGDCNEMSECQLRADVCLGFKSSECPTEQVPSHHGGTLLPPRNDALYGLHQGINTRGKQLSDKVGGRNTPRRDAAVVVFSVLRVRHCRDIPGWVPGPA